MCELQNDNKTHFSEVCFESAYKDLQQIMSFGKNYCVDGLNTRISHPLQKMYYYNLP